MGVAPSKTDDDKVLALCQERKRFVREALDGRCALAASHCAYILSLRQTGHLLRKCFEADALKESIPNISPSHLQRNAARYSFPAARDAGQDFENAADIRRLREELGIPELQDEGENSIENEKNGNLADSEDDFDKPYTETLIHLFKNRYAWPVESTYSSLDLENMASLNTDSHRGNSKNERGPNGSSANENRENPVVTLVNVARSVEGESKEPYPDVSNVVKDLDSCIKEVDILFVWASNSGKEVPRILEEDKIQFRPLLPEEIAHGSKPSSFLQTLIACCWGDVSIPEFPYQAEIKYLTWHRSVSSQLSTSRNPLGTNDGIHISMLDRLYAWESKLYDEIKASSAICRWYDEKCKKLRQQESRGNNIIAIDFTRAVVKDLHSKVLVSLQKIDFISKNIEDIRDKHIQPQLDELIGRMWATMLECHRRQRAIVKLVSSSYNLEISSQSECRRDVAILLTVELRKLCSNFQNWMASLKAYLCSLHLWLHKCIKPLKRRKGHRKKNVVEVVPTVCAVAPIFTTCEVWIKLLNDLPARDMEEAIEGLLADISHSLPHQDETPKDDGMGVGVLTSYTPADVQASLLRFLEKLEAFSEVSLQKYIDLQKDISAAKEMVWRTD